MRKVTYLTNFFPKAKHLVLNTVPLSEAKIVRLIPSPCGYPQPLDLLKVLPCGHPGRWLCNPEATRSGVVGGGTHRWSGAE